jgi:anti-sigma regulatory factor (Ser/Thr protein kinase)
MLCGVSAGLRGLTRFVNPRVSAYRSRQDALMAASKAKSAQPCLHLRLARSLTAPAMARDATRKVCASWDLAALSGPAQLVVSELITNAVVHTEGDVELEIALRDGYFLVRVHDASFVGPVLGQESIDHGRGLRLVGHYSTAWGFSIGGDGKVVWAALRTPRGAARAAAFAGT